MVILPMAATHATLEPDITLNTSHAAMVAMPSAPRTAPTSDMMSSISRRAMPPRDMMSPA